ncbi:MAG: amino acid permease, partial [Planctomycetota bacterium]
MNPPETNPALRRELGLGAAVMLGLGSMVGAGVFVSLGLGAGLVGPAVLGAIAAAGGLAMCNGLSSAQLAAAHPVAGGTYEYGHRVGFPVLGTVAGFMFLVAKSASCATAALGLSGYVLSRFGVDASGGLVVAGALAVV